MTLEPDRDKKPRFRGKKRAQEIIKRAHLKELDAYEGKEAIGVGLTDREAARLKVLREIYNL